MNECANCPQRKVHEVEFRMLDGKLGDLKERVARVETVLGRGIVLLVANLAAAVATMAQQFAR